ncbi:MAG: dipeptidase [Gemmatimonadales bacterium]|nr:dipeptidase [Gemmatimonadales bacterium]
MGLPLALLLMLQHQPVIIVDGHIDTPQRMLDGKADISVRLPDGHVDVPRMKEGGLTAAFFSIWVDNTYGAGTAYRRALALIAAVRALADTAPDAELATTADDVRRAAARGHVAVLMGVEGGHAIENSLDKLDDLYARGVRYMTLTWNNGNDWAGSSMDPARAGGLSPFGRDVVRRMNALGMLVDVSHVSDSTFADVLATTTRPVIASHSSCRALAAHPRNLTDDQLRAIARNGGVVGINFFPVFLDDHFRAQYAELNRRLAPRFDSIRARYPGQPGLAGFEIDRFRAARLMEQRIVVPGLDRLVDHIEHAVQVMGVDHVALGSDFDGISVLPVPMKDATSLPLLAAALKARGYGDSDVRKILGENFLRVLSAAR